MNDFNDLSKVIGMVISVFPILLPIFKFLQNRVLSLVNRHLKEKAIIEKIALELDSPSSQYLYIQDIKISESRLLRNIPFIKISILFRKNISFKNLIKIIELTNKELCFYDFGTKRIQLVDTDDYHNIKKRDIKLHVYFLLGISSLIIFIWILLIPIFTEVAWLQDPNIKLILLVSFYVATLFFEVIWLNRKNPYDSYKSLAKNGSDISCLAGENIIIPHYI